MNDHAARLRIHRPQAKSDPDGGDAVGAFDNRAPPGAGYFLTSNL